MLTYTSTIATGFIIDIVSSSTAPRAEVNTLNTSIYAVSAQMEEGGIATSYIPTTTAPVTRAADDFQEVETPFPSMSDALGFGVTTS
jgi:hypothetical protein